MILAIKLEYKLSIFSFYPQEGLKLAVAVGGGRNPLACQLLYEPLSFMKLFMKSSVEN